MPCPYFQPKQVAAKPEHPGARLPLLDEYDGLCHATAEALAIPSAVRFRCCNHGYSRGICERFPAAESRCGLRYSVLRRTGTGLEILCVEEQEYAPLRWYSLQYFPDSQRIEPELNDTCMRSQVLAFCRSYLKRFPN
jgi:hypothetical protein